MQGTISYGIHYVVDYELDLVGFTDFDWAGDSIDSSPLPAMFLSLMVGLFVGQAKRRLPLPFLQRRKNTGSNQCLHPSSLAARHFV